MPEEKEQTLWQKLIDWDKSPILRLLRILVGRSHRQISGSAGDLKEKDEVENLIEQLKSGDEEKIKAAADRLGELKDPRAVIPLIDEMNKEQDTLYLAIPRALMNIGKPALLPLIGFLKDLKGNKSSYVIAMIEEIAKANPGCPEAIDSLPVLISQLKYSNYIDTYIFDTISIILDNCKTEKQLSEFEKKMEEGLVVLKQECKDGKMLINAKMHAARLKSSIAKAKDSLTGDKGLILEEKPKPPKNIKGISCSLRTMRLS